MVVAVGLEKRVQAGERARERWFLVVDGRREPSSKRSGLVSVSRRGLGSLGLARVGGDGVDTRFRVLVAAVEDELGV
jgi:hypothetical protein